MADINSITNAAQYRGDENLGGSSLGAFKLDVTPLQTLAAYTYQHNQALYNQKQKEIEAAAKEMASLTQYDLNLAPEKDRNDIKKEWNDFYGWVKENPDALDFMHNQDKWLEY